MALPLHVLGVPFASHGSSMDPGATTSLDFAVSGAGNRLQGLMVTSLAAPAEPDAPSKSGVSRSSGGGGEEGDASYRASAEDEWAGFVVQDDPAGQVGET